MPSLYGGRAPSKIQQCKKVHINRLIHQSNIQQINVKAAQPEPRATEPTTRPPLAPPTQATPCEPNKTDKQREHGPSVGQRPVSRIPTAMHHSNQIMANASSASVLWNGIYERHLLNQTKFNCTADDLSANQHVRPTGIDGVADRPTARPSRNEWHTQANKCRLASAWSGAAESRLPRKRLLSHATNAADNSNSPATKPTDPHHFHESRPPHGHINANAIGLGPTMANAPSLVMCAQPSVPAPTVTGHSARLFNGKMCGNRLSAPAMRSTHGDAWSGVSGASDTSKRPPLERGQPVGGNFTASAQRPPPAQPRNANTATATLSVLSAVNAKVGGCDVLASGGGGGRTGASDGGESTLATAADHSAQSKINLMLETAQAMAAAAYFARFVSL